MKIEKVNDRQIRCILTGEDLAKRQLKLSELAYGTEKARSLFRDMMEQAAFQYGFEADDSPLMIEAIPLSSDSIVLVVTKVDHPEELDTRFSNFAPSVQGSVSSDSQQADQSSPFGRLVDSLRRELAADTDGQEAAPDGQAPADAAAAAAPAEKAEIVEGVDVTSLLKGLGGRENILSADHCATRLRMELKDAGLMNEQLLKRAGAKGVIKLGKNSVQVIIGLKVQAVADAVRSCLK